MSTVRRIASGSVILGLLGGWAQASLLLHWPLEEGSGTYTTEQVTGLNNVAQLSTADAWVPGIAPGSTWAFESKAGQHLNAGSLMDGGVYLPGDAGASAVNLPDTYTVTAWVVWKTRAAQTLISSLWNAPAFDFGPYNATGEYRCYLNGNNAIITSGLTMPANTTNFVAVIVDRFQTSGNVSAGNNVRVLYWDGTAYQTSDRPLSVAGAKLRDVTIGCFSSGRGRNFIGIIDDVRIYSTALSWAEIGALTGDTTPPAAPASPTANATGADSVLLDWADNTEPDFASYSVYRSTTSGSGYVLVSDNLTSSTYMDTGLTTGTPYYYVITALDAVGNESAYSSEVTATPVLDETPPAAPTGLTASAASHNAIVLDWADNVETDFASYSVYRSPTSGSGYGLVAGGLTSSTHIDTGLSATSPYYYVVTATDYSGNESAPSIEAGATTLTAPPADLVLWWPLDEGVGVYTTERVTGLPNVAELKGPVVWTDGIAPGSSKAIWLNNSTPASYVDAGTLRSDGVTYVPGIDTSFKLLGDNWTMTAWVKLSSPQTQTGHRGILTAEWAANGWMWHVTGVNRNLHWEFFPSAAVSSIALELDKVYLVALMGDNSGTAFSGSNRRRFAIWDGDAWTYDDGTEFIKPKMQGLEIGSFGTGSRQFEGIIDDVRIYNKTLTEEELTELLQLPPPPPAGTLILLR